MLGFCTIQTTYIVRTGGGLGTVTKTGKEPLCDGIMQGKQTWIESLSGVLVPGSAKCYWIFSAAESVKVGWALIPIICHPRRIQLGAISGVRMAGVRDGFRINPWDAQGATSAALLSSEIQSNFWQTQEMRSHLQVICRCSSLPQLLKLLQKPDMRMCHSSTQEGAASRSWKT